MAHGSSLSGIGLGLASHVLSGLFPFVAAAAIASVGLMPATALVYLAGLTLLLAALPWPAVRALLARETRALVSPALRPLFLAGLAGFLVAGVSYYQGLSQSPRVAEYIFLTRLDWVVQAPVAMLLLKEPWTRLGLTGGAVALAGGVLIAWAGSMSGAGLAAAGLYVGASLVGYLCARPISATRQVPGAVALTAWRHAVNTVAFVLLALPAWRAGAPPIHAAGLSLVLVGGVVIVLLFFLRFTALTRIPLWVLAVQAPVQASVAVVVSLITEGALPPATAAGILMIVAGEVVVVLKRPTARVVPRA